MTVEAMGLRTGPGPQVPTPSRLRGNDQVPAARYLPRPSGCLCDRGALNIGENLRIDGKRQRNVAADKDRQDAV
jgi:hypothetical protein